MSTNSKIEWTDHTFNPWIGCTKISPGCDHCYAAAQDKFRGWTPEGWGGPRRRTSAANWVMPLRWNAQAEAFASVHGRRQRVFCASLADVFDNQVPEEWRDDLFELIRLTPLLDWLLLTKRPQNIVRMVRQSGSVAGNGGRYLPDHVWLGTTAEDQKRADLNIPALMACRELLGARVLFVSIEPLLESVDLRELQATGIPRVWVDALRGRAASLGGSGPAHSAPQLDWVIVGGESGPGARPMHPDWARSLRDQCQAAGVPFLFKQWGEWLPISQQAEEFTQRLYRSNRKARLHEDQGVLDDCYGRRCLVEQAVIHEDGSVHAPLAPMAFLQGTSAMLTFKAGKKAAGRLLDGREWSEVPT